MGSVIDGITGRAAPTLRKLLDHISLTTWLLTQPHVFRLWLHFQHWRPCFAALDHIWKEIVHFHGWHPISTTSADELLSCICMVPLIFTDMRAPLSSRVFCTDASEFGAGGCETIGLTTAGVAASREEAVPAANSSTDVRIDLQLPFRPDAWPRTPICPRKWHWRVILRFPWQKAGAHINELELRALSTLLRSQARSSGNIGMRFAVLVDSWVVLGIALNSILRRLNAHVLASGFYVFFGYVASDANPADEPSRCRDPKWREGQRQDALSDSGEAVEHIWRLRLLPWGVISKRCGISFIIWTIFANQCSAQFGTWMMNFHNTWKNCGQLEMVLLKLNTLWLPCIISAHSCMGEFQALGKSGKPGGDTRCLNVHRRSPQRWSVVLQVSHGYKGVWTLHLASWSVFIVCFAAAKCWGSDFVTVCTLVVQSCSTSVSPRQGQEKESNGISVVIAVLQNIWCACLHALSGNIFRASFLSSVLATKVLPCIPCGAVYTFLPCDWKSQRNAWTWQVVVRLFWAFVHQRRDVDFDSSQNLTCHRNSFEDSCRGVAM